MITTGTRCHAKLAPSADTLGVVLLILGLVSAVLIPGQVRAEQPAEPAPAKTLAQGEQAQPSNEPVAGDLHDASTPVGAVRRYIDACREGDFASAAAMLNLDAIEATERADLGPVLARRLKTVLDQKLWINYERLSSDPRGDLDDGLPQGLELLGTIPADPDVDVLLERVSAADGSYEWGFASSTVEQIPRLWGLYGYGVWSEFLPRGFFEVSFLEINLAQWIGLLLLAVIVWLLSWMLVKLLHAAVRPLVSRTATELDDRLLSLLDGPLRLILAVALFAAGALPLRFAEPVVPYLGAILKAASVLAVTWIALRFVDVLAAMTERQLERIGRASAVAVIPLGRRTLKVVLIGLAVIGVLQNFGVNVTGLIAGLGVGGLAVALAAQKTIANLFGGVSLITDQPVRVGDFCRFGDGKLGTVEQIGLRSTRVRTLDRTLITVPNSDFSEFQLENFAARDRIRLFTVLGLRYETTADQLRFVLAELRKILLAHPMVAADPARVRFVGFGAHSLDLEVYAYVETGDWSEFLKVREDLFLRFIDVVGECGTGFAFPSQTLYLGRDAGLDHELGARAEQQVRDWRESASLPFPDFSPETVEQLSNTADYPPHGSATRAE